LERSSGFTGTDRNSAQESQQHTITDEQPADTDGVDPNQQESITDTADLVTGWEQERAFLFSAEASAANLGMVSDMDSNSLDLAGIGSSVVQLGRSLERLGNPVPVRDCTTKAVVHERKKGIGQKEDDHSGHDFEMKM
jgi:hypothetical protein